jgi:hypothetical protein
MPSAVAGAVSSTDGVQVTVVSGAHREGDHLEAAMNRTKRVLTSTLS